MVKETRLYELLEVEPCVDAATLKKKYRELARKYHPDRNPASEDLFKDISLAYATLTDPEKRNVYDVKGEKGLKKPCCNAPAYPDKKASGLKKSSSSFQDKAEPEITVSSGDENDDDDVEASGSQEFERKPNKNKRKLNIGFENSDEPTPQLKKSKEEGHVLSEHDHDGHDHSGHVHTRHGHSGQDHASHDHSGHAGHDHFGHGHAEHDHSGNDHAGHDHSGHAHAGHDHSGHSHDDHYDSDDDEESEDDAEEGEGGCPCCPAIGMSPAMMQQLMRMQMEMQKYGARGPGGQMYGYYGPPGSS